MKATEKTALKEANELPEPNDNKASNEEKKEETPSMTKSEILILISLALNEFILGIYFSMLAPFFPNEARKKGVSHLMIGLILGVYSVMLIIMSPIMGYNIGRIGQKFMLMASLVSCGVCSILLGFMSQSPPGAPFISICLILRIIEGIAAAGFVTASYSFIAELFPDRTATFLGILQSFTSLGLIVGPPVGGLLFQAGGFRLPFIVTGVVMIILGIPPLILLPNKEAADTKMNFSNLKKVCSSPTILMTCVILVNTSSMVGFISVGLSPVLINIFHLSASIVGVFFLIASVALAISAPILGMVADKKPKSAIWIIVAGSIGASLSMFLLEPASTNLVYRTGLAMIIVVLIAEGIAMSVMGPAFTLLLETAQNENLPDNFETYGLMSSILTSTFSFGEFVGPLAGGALIDGLGFGKASTTTGYIMVAVTVVALVGVIWSEVKKAKSKQDDEEKLTETPVGTLTFMTDQKD